MTEQEWQSCARPELLLHHLARSLPVAPRKRKCRLFLCGCCRRVPALLADPASRQAVEVAEQYADGQATPHERDSARWALHPVHPFHPPPLLPLAEPAHTAALAGVPTGELLGAAETIVSRVAYQRTQARLGPFRVELAGEWKRVRAEEREGLCRLLRDIFGNPFSPPKLADGILAWNGGCVVKLAAAIYDGREFSPERMGVLADALEDAGVTDEAVLRHCRGGGEVHARGCWLVDLLLGKS